MNLHSISLLDFLPAVRISNTEAKVILLITQHKNITIL